MPSCQRTNAVDLHTFDKKREGGRDPLTQQLKSPGRQRQRQEDKDDDEEVLL